MGRMVLGNAAVALFTAVAGTLMVTLFGGWTLRSAAPTAVGMFVGITVFGTVREWQRSRRLRR